LPTPSDEVGIVVASQVSTSELLVIRSELAQTLAKVPFTAYASG